MGKGLYYGSYKAPRVLLWIIGVVIFLVMIITAFLGYSSLQLNSSLPFVIVNDSVFAISSIVEAEGIALAKEVVQSIRNVLLFLLSNFDGLASLFANLLPTVYCEGVIDPFPVVQQFTDLSSLNTKNKIQE
jgi:hypothetical protein